MAATKNTIVFFQAQKKISLLWFVFSGIIFLLIFFQTLFGKYEDKIEVVWNWLLPNLIPTLSIILSVFFAEFNQRKRKEKHVDRFYYKLVIILSLFYLCVLLLIILLDPFINKSFLETISKSNYYLVPLQCIVGISIGFFFVKSN